MVLMYEMSEVALVNLTKVELRFTCYSLMLCLRLLTAYSDEESKDVKIFQGMKAVRRHMGLHPYYCVSNAVLKVNDPAPRRPF